MAPSGSKAPYIYLLGLSPSREDDDEDIQWCDAAGAAIYKKFGRDWMEKDVRSNYITQCRGEESVAAVECCRPRIVADIEETRPLVIVGIGDEVLRWATGISPASALTHRGALFAVKIGNHTCWYYPILYPNFVHKKGGRKSEYETVLEHDIRWIKHYVSGLNFRPAKVATKPYDAGIEIITGTEPGDMQRLEAALGRLAKKPKSGIDVETPGLRVHMQANPMLLCAAVGTHDDTVAFSIDHPEGWGTQAQRKRVHKLFLRYLLESGEKFAHNLAMEMEWLSFFYGDEILRLTQWGDTMAMGHGLDERKGSKSLNVQVIRRLGFDLKSQSRVDVSRPEWWLEYPLKDILRYNGLDTKWTDALRMELEPEINANPAYRYEYERKVRTASTLVIMENQGMPVDMAFAKEMQKRLDDELDAVEAKIKRCPEVQKYKERFGTFQPGNPDQVLRLLRDICKRDEVAVRDRDGNKTGESTSEEILSVIPASEVPSAPLVLEHRGISKLLSTYIDPIVSRKIVCVDGLLRSKYGSMEAETGRFNSEDPNIQNWPKRKHKEVRGIIAARALGPGQKMVACDFGQIEFRVVGMASEDKNLVKYCWTGYDVHKYWAERMIAEYPAIKDRIVEEFHIDWDKDGLKTLRQDAKNMWVFPQLFGSSVRSCADNLRIPYEIMEDLAAEFWDEFSGAKRWQEKLLESYEKRGYVETLDGRRRRGAMSLNQIINHPIQGTALSIVCAGMNALSERAFAEERMECHPRFNGHDDLSFFMEEANIEANVQIITEEMCRPRFDFVIVPLIVEVSVGDRWNEMKEIRKVSSEKLFRLRNPYTAP
jgi:DNA polymerase I-like protein with 3'-5' exonuclease and polymerase domains/uracil-DNA glycosylase